MCPEWCPLTGGVYINAPALPGQDQTQNNRTKNTTKQLRPASRCVCVCVCVSLRCMMCIPYMHFQSANLCTQVNVNVHCHVGNVFTVQCVNAYVWWPVCVLACVCVRWRVYVCDDGCMCVMMGVCVCVLWWLSVTASGCGRHMFEVKLLQKMSAFKAEDRSVHEDCLVTRRNPSRRLVLCRLLWLVLCQTKDFDQLCHKVTRWNSVMKAAVDQWLLWSGS